MRGSDRPDDPPGWVVFGVRTAFAVEVAEIIWRRDEQVLALVDNLPDPPAQPWADGIAVVPPGQVDDRLRGGRVAIPQTSPGARFAVTQAASGVGFGRFDPLLDPGASIARTAHIDAGVVVGAGAIVGGLARLAQFVLVNRGVTVGHHSQVDPYASLGPGCVLAGSVRIGRGAFVGAGAVVAPEVTVGPNATVGAGAVVIGDVPANAVVVGNPARIVRTDSPGFGGSSVPVSEESR